MEGTTILTSGGESRFHGKGPWVCQCGSSPHITTMDSDSDRIRNAIADILDEDGEEAHFIGDLTLVAEMIGPDSETYLFHLTSDSLTVWKERGMLMYRLDMLAGRTTVVEIERNDQ